MAARSICLLICLAVCVVAQADDPTEENGSSSEVPTERRGDGADYFPSAPISDELPLEWVHSTASEVRGSALLVRSPVPLVVFGAASNYLTALHFLNGSVVWKRQERGSVRATPVLFQHIFIFVATLAATVSKRAVANGELLWQYTHTQPSWVFQPSVVDGSIFVGIRESRLLVLDVEDGHLQWSVTTTAGVWADPLVLINSVVFGVTAEAIMMCVSRTAPYARIWSYDAASGVVNARQRRAHWLFAPPRLDPATGLVVFGGVDRSLRALATQRGELTWLFEASGRIDSAAVFLMGCVLFVTSDGVVYAIHSRSGRPVWAVALREPVEAGLSLLREWEAVVAVTSRGTVVIINIRTHQEVWRTVLPKCQALASPTPAVLPSGALTIVVTCKSGDVHQLLPNVTYAPPTPRPKRRSARLGLPSIPAAASGTQVDSQGQTDQFVSTVMLVAALVCVAVAISSYARRKVGCFHS